MERSTAQGAPSKRVEVRRLPERGAYDPDLIASILDEALICHVGLVRDGHPVVIPTIHARVGRTLYVHGSPASRLLREMKQGSEVCVAASILDGIVLARSAFHHSMNYRSVVVFGVPRFVDDPKEKMVAFRAVTEHVLPGRWADTRPPNDTEIKGTLIMALAIEEASAKMRTGGPSDDADDLDLPHWAGVLPTRIAYGPPEPDAGAGLQGEVPGYLENYRRP